MAEQIQQIEDEIEFDENDNKIIQLYEVINELVDEQKARIEDMELLYSDKGNIALQNVEHRNNSVLNQIFSDLELKEKNYDDEDDEDSDSDDSEDEQDQGWEIYNTVVSNLNSYMGQVALFTQKLDEQRQKLEDYEVPNDDEIKELENVVEQQTNALEQQMKRNEDLENALSSVLNEYSNRITVGNEEIASLHEQLSITNKQHSKQIQELRAMYEKKIAQLQKSQDNQYKEEVSQLIDTLATSRTDFQKQITALTQEMSEAQTNHHREMLTLTQYNQTLTEALAEKTLLVEELKSKSATNKPQAIKLTLRKLRTTLDIDDDEEYFYSNKSYKNGLNIDSNKQQLSAYNGSKKTRTFTPSNYTSSSSSNNGHQNQNQHQHQHQHHHNQSSKSSKQQKQRQFKYNLNDNNGSSQINGSTSNGSSSTSSALQAKYAQYKSGSKGYKSRSKNKYGQKTY